MLFRNHSVARSHTSVRCGKRRGLYRPQVERLESRLALALVVPALSSLPGANHTIYLDFDGHVTTGTSWNSSYSVTNIDSPAYSTDADFANFSSAELSVIQNAWKRVAEDFAPFQVNVTTVEPVVGDLIKSGSTDTRWGVRVVITDDVAFNCGCGGIAYIDSFNWNSDTPVYVFNSGEVGVAEAISHEVGHALGLAHDGTSTVSYYQGHGSGATSWSPIMGVGYYVNVSQWDKGEYTGANNVGSGANYGKGPDDLSVITTYNGFGYKVDDHGGTDATATSLTVSGTSLAGSGVIERTADVDVFRFTTGAGAVSLNINPAALGANLDIKANLVDSLGVIVATSNPSTALNASFNVTLSAGTYYVRIDGVGVGDPTAASPTGYSEYASLGQYTIAGTLVPTNSDSLGIAATDTSKSEGNSGSTTHLFTVTRTGDTSGTTTVNYSVAGSGSSPANATDFLGGVLPSGALTFLPGETSQVISISVAGDSTVEANETFQVSLSGASGTTSITQGFATGTILNDDVAVTPPTLSITATAANKSEGTNSTTPTPFIFTITRNGDSSGTASVNYSVSGTGSKPANSSDFVGGFPTNVVVNFAAGQTSATVTISVVADSTKESNETFRVSLSNAVGAAISTSTANGSIVNDDGGGGRPRIPSESGSRSNDSDEDEAGRTIIAVADPVWYFVPPSTPGYVTGIAEAIETHYSLNGADHFDDHDEFADHDHDHESELELGPERSFAEVFAMLHGHGSNELATSSGSNSPLSAVDDFFGKSEFRSLSGRQVESGASRFGSRSAGVRDKVVEADEDALDVTVVEDISQSRRKEAASTARQAKRAHVEQSTRWEGKRQTRSDV
ncbi:MAG: Calx-beta domain-containing protein [Pirellulales bacterium]